MHSPLLLIVLHTLVLIALVTGDADSPNARVAIWDSRGKEQAKTSKAGPRYQTQTTLHSQVMEHLHTAARNAEVLGFFQHDPRAAVDASLTASSIISTHMKDLIEASKSATLFPNVHVSSSDTSVTTGKLTDTLLGEKMFKDAKEVSLQEFSNLLSDANANVLKNGQLDVYTIRVSPHDESQQKALSSVKNVAGLICVAVEDSLREDSEVPKKAGHYNRILLDDTTTSNDNLFYKPEGAEYSMYYANTYLYITPEIFTGLMTGIFCFFVFLIGFSCLGSIQGPASFVAKGPYVGRDA